MAPFSTFSMPRPFSFAAAFMSASTEPPSSSSQATDNSSGNTGAATTAAAATATTTTTAASDDASPRIPCAPPLLSLKLPNLPTIPHLYNKREHPSLRSTQCAIAMGSGPCQCGTPEELIVLAHGLQGAVADFNYLLDGLDAAVPARAGRVLVHASSVNTERTHDGVVAGGERLAYDIRAVIASHPSLTRVSLVGFSLGGLYVRYAAAVLFDAQTGLVAGLKPSRLIAVAAPHLGVRAFGVYRFLPPAVRSRAHLLIGATGREMFLEDAETPLLLRMTMDEPNGGPRPLPFLSALRAFEKRYLYANTRNDFMVNWGTATLDHTVGELNVNAETTAPSDSADRADVDRAYDERGCKVCYTFRYPQVDNDDDHTQRNDDGEGGDGGEKRAESREDSRSGDEERVMAERLRRVGWTVVAVEFPVTLPIAHNRIVAMSRNPIHTWMNAAGRRVVHHLVDTLMDSFTDSCHEPTFQKVEEAAPKRSLSLRNFVSDS